LIIFFVFSVFAICKNAELLKQVTSRLWKTAIKYLGSVGVFHSPCFYLFSKINKNISEKEVMLKKKE